MMSQDNGETAFGFEFPTTGCFIMNDCIRLAFTILGGVHMIIAQTNLPWGNDFGWPFNSKELCTVRAQTLTQDVRILSVL